jgi:tetratricopeptide (TPR) repeat protein
MRRAFFSLAIVLAFAAVAKAQIGKSVPVPAGSPEDKALSEIYSATDPAQKIALLDKFMADYGKGDMALLAYQLYVSAYQAQKDYGKTFEYGDKVLELDPDNFSTVVMLVRAAQEKDDTAKLFDYSGRAAAILKRYQAVPPPEGLTASEWQEKQAATLRNVAEDVNYIEYAMFTAAYQTQAPAAKAGLLERFMATFPDSPYTTNALQTAAFAYQQAQNYPKMLDTAQKLIAADPNNFTMHVLLADYWSERGQAADMEKAEASAKKALDLLAQAKKPDNVPEDQWHQQVNLQKGLAYSALGQVYVVKGRNAAAVDAFKQADPLLKPNPTAYGRNLYRLGFTLAKMQRMDEARVVLTEAVSVNSPYRALAQQTLDKIGGSARARH